MCKAIYSYGAYQGVINFYTQKNLQKMVLTEEMNKIYEETMETDEKPLCINETLVVPIFVW